MQLNIDVGRWEAVYTLWKGVEGLIPDTIWWTQQKKFQTHVELIAALREKMNE